jgi:hypothetical protein
MNIYETIISILDEKGPLSIPLICQEVNDLLVTERSHILSPLLLEKKIYFGKGREISP